MSWENILKITSKERNYYNRKKREGTLTEQERLYYNQNKEKFTSKKKVDKTKPAKPYKSGGKYIYFDYEGKKLEVKYGWTFDFYSMSPHSNGEIRISARGGQINLDIREKVKSFNEAYEVAIEAIKENPHFIDAITYFGSRYYPRFFREETMFVYAGHMERDGNKFREFANKHNLSIRSNNPSAFEAKQKLDRFFGR